MKKHFIYLTAILAISMIFAACKKNDSGDNTNNNTAQFIIEATNVLDAISDIATAKAHFTYSDEDFDVLATAKYENGKFQLTLPNTMESRYLHYAADSHNFYEEWVSDIEAKTTLIGMLGIYAYDKMGDVIGIFYCAGENSSTSCHAYYVYADRKFTITGTEGYEIVNCTFNKGWNIVYCCCINDDDELSTTTTQKPAGITMKWHYEDSSNSKKGK